MLSKRANEPDVRTWHRLQTRVGGVIPTSWIVLASLVMFPFVPAVVVGFAARFPEAAAPLSVVAALMAIAMASGTEPIHDISYSLSGLRLRRWNGKIREVPWDRLACVSILLEGPTGASLVFHVRSDLKGRNDRFVLLLAGAWQGGLPPRLVIRKLAEQAPVRMVVEVGRWSWRMATWISVWFVTGAASGLVLAWMVGPFNLIAGLGPIAIGVAAILVMANFGAKHPIVVEAGTPPPSRVPRVYGDWTTALAERTP